jgi:hypothetical protein
MSIRNHKYNSKNYLKIKGKLYMIPDTHINKIIVPRVKIREGAAIATPSFIIIEI